MRPTRPTFSVIIPCFNEHGAITSTVNELGQILGEYDSYEVIVVDDGSTDGSSAILDTMEPEAGYLKVIHHARNRGYGAALKTGIRRAEGELIVITDADGTYPNDMIPRMLDAMDDTDMVVGARTGEAVVYSRLRQIPKAFLSRYCNWITGQVIPDMNSGLRVFRKSVAERFLHVLPNSFSFTTTITLAMMTNDYLVRFVPINYSERIGKSKIRPVRDTLRFIQLIFRTGLYFAPIRTFMPIIIVFFTAFVASASYDVFVQRNLTDKTLVFLMLTVNSAFFVLLADILDKRTNR